MIIEIIQVIETYINEYKRMMNYQAQNEELEAQYQTTEESPLISSDFKSVESNNCKANQTCNDFEK